MSEIHLSNNRITHLNKGQNDNIPARTEKNLTVRSVLWKVVYLVFSGITSTGRSGRAVHLYATGHDRNRRTGRRRSAAATSTVRTINSINLFLRTRRVLMSLVVTSGHRYMASMIVKTVKN